MISSHIIWYIIKIKAIMLQRDIYIADPAQTYFPDFNVVNYSMHLAGAKPYYRYMLTKK